MKNKSIFKDDRNYTFSDYYNMPHLAEEILAEFGYGYEFATLNLPNVEVPSSAVERLQKAYFDKLPFIKFVNETGKREFYVAPLLWELLDHTKFKINTEYYLDGGKNLVGTTDYLLEGKSNFLIIEAKKGDLEAGFNQLAAEMIAFDKLSDDEPTHLWGAITVGDFWRFARLERRTKILRKDINAYTLPTDLHQLFSILLGILSENPQ